jgi:ferrous iron transport protein B
VLFSLVALVLSGMALNRTIFKGQRSAFIMEMPLYHLPNARTIGLLVWQRTTSFITKAGTVILAMAIVVWALSTLPNGDLPTSFLARFGRLLAPIGGWMGLDWRLTVALITSFPAKENAIATLGVLFGNISEGGLAQALAATFSIATATAFLTVSLLFIPCMATVAAIRQESGSWRWALADIGMFLVLSIAAGSAVFHVLRAIGY